MFIPTREHLSLISQKILKIAKTNNKRRKKKEETTTTTESFTKGYLQFSREIPRLIQRNFLDSARNICVV